MSQPSLPDDPERWPTDPFQLLGVPRDVSARDLKRTYTQLIRQYKPEQKPEEFRLIRQAYEIVRQIREWNVLFADAESGVEITAPLAAGSDGDDATGRYWRLAIDDDPAAGYAGLCEQARGNPRQLDLQLRLYWLLTLFPDVDPARSPIDWLLAAVRQPGANGPARELLKRELYDRPRETLAATDALLDADWPAEALCDLAAARWLAALRLHELDTIRYDLDRLRPRVQGADEGAWLRLQMCVLDAVAWLADEVEASQLQARCHDEVRRLEHRALSEGHAFDRMDHLFLLASAWRTFRRMFRVPDCLAELIPISWSGPYSRLAPLVERVLDAIVAQPRVWLGWFDELYEHAPVVLDYFNQVLLQYGDRLETPPIDPHTPTRLASLAGDCLEQMKAHSYPSMRPTIMEFCLDEFVTVEMFAAVAPPTKINSHRAMVKNLHDALMLDWPLRLVCWANRLFWA